MAKIKLAIKLILLLSLLGSMTTPAAAAPDEVKWSQVNLPTEGKLGDWVLASGSDVQHLTMAIDGSLYCYANPSGTSYTLFKSMDGGYSWSYTDYDQAIVALVGSSIDADIIYISDGSKVYKSDDAGDSFDELATGSLEALDFTTTGEEITCLAVGYVGDEPYVFIGTANETAGGGVYYIHNIAFGGGWTDLDVGNYDVYSIACSPDFATDSQVIAVVTDKVHTYAIYNYGVISEWTRVELLDASDTSFAITAASNLCFPSDFNQTHEWFVGAVGGDGGIYRVDEDYSYRFDIDTDIISLDLAGELGNLQLLAGENNNAEVWYSIDDGDSWDSTTKAPSGSGPTYVVMTDDFADSGKAYAATSGSESAFSYTTDGGITWNQIGLIDTGINIIIDLAISPNYSQDNTLFMLTWGGEHSLWRSLNDGTSWERVFTSALANVDSISLVELSPQYGNGSQVVFLAGISNGNSAIWKSTNDGQSFNSLRTIPPPIDTWAVISDTALFIGSHDGSNGLVYQTTNSGLSYSSAVAGNQPLSSIVLSPDYNEDETILVSNSDGWVYWSDDNGASFEPLPPDATSPPLTGSITVAFDSQFGSRSTVYAASDTGGKGVYRFTIGTDTEWENIDSPAGAMLRQLRVSADGTLYATNSKPDGGIERSLNPTYSLGPTFETVTRGLDDGATLTKLWLYDNRLWSVDTANTRLMTFTDSLTLPVTLTSPPNQAPGIGTIINYTVSNVSLDWEVLRGATDYEWQLSDDTNFSSPVEGDTEASRARLPALELATTYYWRVRASEPMLSPWSDKWSFTTALGYASIAPNLLNPEAGANGIPLKPVLQWSDVAGADSYELIVSTDVSLENPIILKVGDYALPSTAWQCNINLDYDTTYYWKVRAISSDTYSAWSAASAFTTESPPPPLEEPPPEEPQEPPAPSPSAPPQPTTPDWVKYLFGALLASVVLLSVIVLMLVRGMRRL